jgi:hypothetical protein
MISTAYFGLTGEIKAISPTAMLRPVASFLPQPAGQG